MEEFKGYTPEVVDFLWGIRLNNNREWFAAHKQQYTDALYAPTKALGAVLFRPFMDRPGHILKVSRIYRDARMHHPLPYKESLWICIRQDVPWWAESPCLFFEIDPDAMRWGFSLWQPKPADMERFRRDIAARPEAFLNMLAGAERRTGLPVSARSYCRPKPAEDPRLQPFFGWRDRIACVYEEPFGPDSFSPGLADRVSEFLDAVTPLYNYFNQLPGE